MAPTSRTELAVLALLVVSVAMLAVGCGGDDTATPNPTPSLAPLTSTTPPDTASPAPTSTPVAAPDPTPTAQPTTPERVPVEELTWQWLPSPANGIPVDVSITGLFRVDDQLIATGIIYGLADTQSVIFLSADGVTWEQITDDAFGGPTERHLNAVAPGGPGLVAAGTEILFDANGDQVNNPIIWVSADGRDWERVTDPDLTSGGRQEVFTVLATPVGLIASGWGVDDFSVRDEDFMVWLSADGRDWERITAGLQAPGPQRVGLDPEINRHSTTSRGTVVIVGRRQLPRDPNLLPAIWISANGTTWQPATGMALSQPGELNSVTANGDLFVSVGSDGTNALVLVSSDGRTWERVAQDTLDAPGTQRMSGIEPYGDGLIAVGYNTKPSNNQYFPAVWISSDGRHWKLLDLAATTPPPTPDQRLAYIAHTPTGIIIMSQSDDPHILIGQPDPTR